jgi:hypothetical protein
MSCYNIQEWHSTSTPLLSIVKNAYILTMRDSKRLKSEQAQYLKNICATTFVQINNGFKNCRKSKHITNTALDLTDAYRNVFMACKHILEPVLVLEDDALLFETDREHFERVDAFLADHEFDVYSLGSFGMFAPFDFSYHKKFVNSVSYSQAVVWPQKTRDRFLEIMDANPESIIHIDGHFLSNLKFKYSYHIPLIVQVFPETLNKETWCSRCKGEKVEKMAFDVWNRFLLMVDLDERPHGWKSLYIINHNFLRILASIVILIYIVTTQNKLKKDS